MRHEDVKVGQVVRIISGPFKGSIRTIKELDKNDRSWYVETAPNQTYIESWTADYFELVHDFVNPAEAEPLLRWLRCK